MEVNTINAQPNVSTPEWLLELTELVQRNLDKLNQQKVNQRPAYEAELSEIRDQIQGWLRSLANKELSSAIRTSIESAWTSAQERCVELETLILMQDASEKIAQDIVDPALVLARVNQLSDVLASNNPTMGNLHLSMHIDRITCSIDGTVNVRVCKLGALRDAIEVLAEANAVPQTIAINEVTNNKKGQPRRRGRLSVDTSLGDAAEIRALAEFTADTDRFAGLSDDFFWTEEFQIPETPPNWVVTNAEAVFFRRQESKQSLRKLAVEFGVSKPTIAASVRHYLAEHPDAEDKVKLPCGGQRPPKFHVEEFSGEARGLWENGVSKLKLAKRYGCSTPVIDKALKHAYGADGLPVPTRKELKAAAAAKARGMLDAGTSLESIAVAMGVSDVTARKLLNASFAAEGKTMPDFRRKENKH